MRLRRRAVDLGFAELRIAAADVPADRQDALRSFLARGHHGTMGWLAATFARRRAPRALWSEARTALVLGFNYGPATDPLGKLHLRERGVVSVYAQGDDYHAVLKGRLKHLAQWLAAQTGAAVKVFVDTAPLMEKPLAERAGLGWQGKHTNVVSRRSGSWLFLGVILTDLDLPTDSAETDHCGACRRCVDICPTAAFPQPYRLDARRCISYLTIEHAGPIPHAFRPGIGNRIYGCDDCLAICPWNKFATTAREVRLRARAELETPPLADLARLDERAFRGHFRRSPIKRIGRNRFLRNVLVAVGNSAERDLSSVARSQLADPDPVVRGAAVWALGRLLDRHAFADLATDHVARERSSAVRREWRVASAVGRKGPRS